MTKMPQWTLWAAPRGPVIALVALASTFAACSSAERMATRPIEPAPTAVQSVVFLPEAPPDETFYDEYVSPVSERTRFAEMFRNYRPEKDRMRRLVERGITRAARVAASLEDPTVEGLVERYDQKVTEVTERYGEIEGTLTRTLGIREEEFRTGLGVTAATTAATIGAIHMLQPVAISDELFGTGVRAGYDLSRLDDPKMLLSYGERLGVTFSKKGVGGSLGSESGIVYSADLNIVDRSAAASVHLREGVSLGTLYAHREEELKGFVSLRF